MDNVLVLPEVKKSTENVANEVVLKAGTPMERLTVKEFVQLHGFKSFIHQLRLTELKVPFVTFMMPNNKAKNIHLSKNAGIIFDSLGIEPYKTVLEMDIFDDIRFMWAETPKAEGGYSWKIVSANSGESNRTEFNY
jgi:hypothetical protein